MIKIDFHYGTDYGRLLEFLRRTNEEYSPPLSERESGIEGFLERWSSNQRVAVVAEEENRIVGSIGFIMIDELTHIYWFSILPDLKRPFLPFQMIRFGLKNNRYLGKQPLVARTRPGNEKTERWIRFLGGECLDDSLDSKLVIRTIEKVSPTPHGMESIYFKISGPKAFGKIIYS